MPLRLPFSGKFAGGETELHYDPDGMFAAQGTVLQPVLEAALKLPYLQ